MKIILDKIYSLKAPFIKYEGFIDGESNFVHGIDFGVSDEYSDIGEAAAEGLMEYKAIKIVSLEKPLKNRVLYRKRLTCPRGVVGTWQPVSMTTEKGFNNLLNGTRWNYDINA